MIFLIVYKFSAMVYFASFSLFCLFFIVAAFDGE